jgi:hypothetical protein
MGYGKIYEEKSREELVGIMHPYVNYEETAYALEANPPCYPSSFASDSSVFPVARQARPCTAADSWRGNDDVGGVAFGRSYENYWPEERMDAQIKVEAPSADYASTVFLPSLGAEGFVTWPASSDPDGTPGTKYEVEVFAVVEPYQETEIKGKLNHGPLVVKHYPVCWYFPPAYRSSTPQDETTFRLSTVPGGLGAGLLYAIRVRAVDGADDTLKSNWSPLWFFRR